MPKNMTKIICEGYKFLHLERDFAPLIPWFVSQIVKISWFNPWTAILYRIEEILTTVSLKDRDILKIIGSLKVNKAQGQDDISVRFAMLKWWSLFH